jgi:hypothetical protein
VCILNLICYTFFRYLFAISATKSYTGINLLTKLRTLYSSPRFPTSRHRVSVLILSPAASVSGRRLGQDQRPLHSVTPSKSLVEILLGMSTLQCCSGRLLSLRASCVRVTSLLVCGSLFLFLEASTTYRSDSMRGYMRFVCFKTRVEMVNNKGI